MLHLNRLQTKHMSLRTAVQNKDLTLQLNRAKDELIQAKSGNSGTLGGTGVLTYSQLREKAKADEEAVAEIKKLKHLHTQGAERLGRLQQDNEQLSQQINTLKGAKEAAEKKVGKLEDKIRALRKSVRICGPTCTAATRTAPIKCKVLLAF